MLRSGLLISLIFCLLQTGNNERKTNIPRQGAALPEFSELRADGYALFKQQKYAEAASVFARGYDLAVRRVDACAAAHFANNHAGMQFSLFRYRSALDGYLTARRFAAACGDPEQWASMAVNISSLYWRMGDVEAAAQAARESLALLPPERQSKYRLNALLNQANLLAQSDDLPQAIEFFQEAIRAAELHNDSEGAAKAYGLLGSRLIHAGRLDEAERALAEALRIESLLLRDVTSSLLRTLGRLRREQGDLFAAERLLDRALDRARIATRVPVWALYYDRGLTRRLRHDLEGAYADLHHAIDLARRNRTEILPADTFRLGADAYLQAYYSAVVETGISLYSERKDPRFALESFEATEQNRAVSLRALLDAPEDWQRRLPDHYWEDLARLQSAETALLRRDSAEVREQIRRLRYRLTEAEVQAGLTVRWNHQDEEQGILDRCRRGLSGDEALHSFHVGEQESYRWTVTDRHFSVDKLPGRAQLSESIRAFRTAVLDGAGDAPALGAQLFGTLFGSLDPSVHEKHRWSFALDAGMFELPFAALVTGRQENGRPVYLVERHALRVVPGAVLMARGEADSPAYDSFLGVADPVYNFADPRWKNSSVRLAGLSLFLQPKAAETLTMPRLVGSGREVRACSAGWTRSQSLLGLNASRQGLSEALENGYSVLHLAAHIVQLRTPRPAIALSLRPDGAPELLTPADVAAMRAPLDLVVLSGCNSGRGPALPGDGLQGFTRAWMIAGAREVIAAQWPTPDDDGRLFLSFYRHLRGRKESGVNAALALRHAQMESLRSPGWRSEPRYWAAYFTVGKD